MAWDQRVEEEDFVRYWAERKPILSAEELEMSAGEGKGPLSQYVREPGEFITVIVPCRNEKEFIGLCLDSVIETDFPKDHLEVLVVDGMSNDGTREILERYKQRSPAIRVLDNPRFVTPSALNIGISHAKGDFIFRIDAHAQVEKTYFSKCIAASKEFDAAAVGGTMTTLPRDGGFIGEGIVSVLSHPFGVGNSHFRIHTDKPRLVDTVFCACYRRTVFDKVGLFNEDLHSSQDMEFHLRLKKAGGRILLVPGIESFYYTRSCLVSFLRNNFRNGRWAVLPFLYSSIVPVSWRHLVPLAFVLGLAGTAALSFLGLIGSWAIWGITGAYLAASLLASASAAPRGGKSSKFLLLPVLFFLLHTAYGLGSLSASLQLIASGAFWKKLLSKGSSST